jgi:predicted nuclease of predicted toxin-antitoxin system
VATIRFHLDEHVSPAVAAGLRQLGIDVTTTAGAGLLGASDEAHIAFALAETRVIFTQDDDFLVLASQGVEHAGLAYCRQNSRTIGEVIRALEMIHGVYEAEEMRNRIEFL